MLQLRIYVNGAANKHYKSRTQPEYDAPKLPPACLPYGLLGRSIKSAHHAMLKLMGRVSLYIPYSRDYKYLHVLILEFVIETGTYICVGYYNIKVVGCMLPGNHLHCMGILELGT